MRGASVKLLSCITLSAPLGNLLSVKLIFICYFIHSLREPYEMAAVIPILEVRKKKKKQKPRLRKRNNVFIDTQEWQS